MSAKKPDLGLAEAVDAVDAMKSNLGIGEETEKNDLWGCIKVPLVIALWGGFLLGGTFFIEWVLRSIFHFPRTSNTSATILTSAPWLLLIFSVIIFGVWIAHNNSKKNTHQVTAFIIRIPSLS